MNTMKSTIKTLVCGLGLVAVLYNCKTKDVDSLTPFTYTFKGFDDVKLPEVKATAPAAVSVTQATVTPSVATAAVSQRVGQYRRHGPVPGRRSTGHG